MAERAGSGGSARLSDTAVFFVSTTFSVAVGAIILAISALIRPGLGAKDGPFVLLFAVSLAIFPGVGGVLLRPRYGDRSLLVRGAVSVIGGAVFCGTFYLYLALGWGGSLAAPVLVTGLGVGVAGFAGGLLAGPWWSQKSVRLVRVVAIGAITAVVSLALIEDELERRRDRTLTLWLVRWQPGPEPLRIRRDGRSPMDGASLKALRAAVESGELDVWGWSRSGRGSAATAILVLRAPVAGRISLPQPESSVVVYVQEDGGFRMHPPGARFIDRELVVMEDNGRVWYEIERVGGNHSGHSGFHW